MKRHKTHWSRKPEQIRQDTEFLRKAGLAFQEVAGTFSRFKAVPPLRKREPQIVAFQLDLFKKEPEA